MLLIDNVPIRYSYFYPNIKRISEINTMQQLLGKNIAKRRHKLNMTQQELAELSNLSINFISRLERGRSNTVSSTTLLSLASALGTSMDSLMANPTAQENETHYGPHLTKLISKLESYDYPKTEHLSKIILELLEDK